jgi:hypothetical protein
MDGVGMSYTTLNDVPTDLPEATDRDGRVWKRYDATSWHIPHGLPEAHESNYGHVVEAAATDQYGLFKA